jgi:hypothetical protein
MSVEGQVSDMVASPPVSGSSWEKFLAPLETNNGFAIFFCRHPTVASGRLMGSGDGHRSRCRS